jgi:hypothetical protein
MSELEIKAIKKLPDEYVKDGTIIAVAEGKYVVIMNPNLPPIVFDNGEFRQTFPA